MAQRLGTPGLILSPCPESMALNTGKLQHLCDTTLYVYVCVHSFHHILKRT